MSERTDSRSSAAIVVALGHEVIAPEVDAEDVGAVTARQRPDVALVGLGENSGRRHLHAMRRRQGGGESAKNACSRLVRPESP
jgi:hypothetical protein